MWGFLYRGLCPGRGFVLIPFIFSANKVAAEEGTVAGTSGTESCDVCRLNQALTSTTGTQMFYMSVPPLLVFVLPKGP